MTSLVPFLPPIPLRPAGLRVGALILASTGCLPLPNDLGDTATTTGATAGPTDSTTTEPVPPGDGTSPGRETDPTASGSTTAIADGTATAADTEADTDTDTDTDGEILPPTVFDCVLDEPCISGYFGCSSHTGCEGEPPPVWGAGALCVLELARDIRTMPGASAEINFERGGSPDWTSIESTYLLFSDGTVLTQWVLHDTKFGDDNWSAPRQCVLQPPEYFQACLDDPQYDCGEPDGWLTDCVDLVDFECPGP